MFGKTILFLGQGQNLTLMQRAEEIYRIQFEISNLLEKRKWIIGDKVSIDINNKEDTIFKILKEFKKTVHRNTVLKDIHDNFTGASTGLLVYDSKYNDNSLIFKYNLGNKNEISKHSEILVFNSDILIMELGVNDFKEFVKNMARLSGTETIEVNDPQLGLELQETLGSSVDVQIINDEL